VTAGRRLVLLRHGRTAWNDARRIQGQADAPLDPTGHEQAHRVAAALATMRPAVLWSSDLSRAADTASYLAAEAGLVLALDARLRETMLGERQGTTHEEYAAAHPQEYAAFARGDFDVVPGGEKSVAVRARMIEALRELLVAVPAGGVGVAVTHGHAAKHAVAGLLDWPGEAHLTLRGMDNCAWAELDQPVPGAPLRLRAWNRAPLGPVEPAGPPPDFPSRPGCG
jgi:broad specificity phosphatase PhoE